MWIQKKMFGYFTLDCIFVYNNERSSQNTDDGFVYVIGLDYFLNEKTSSLFVPSLVSKAHYNKDLNILISRR